MSKLHAFRILSALILSITALTIWAQPPQVFQRLDSDPNGEAAAHTLPNQSFWIYPPLAESVDRYVIIPGPGIPWEPVGAANPIMAHPIGNVQPDGTRRFQFQVNAFSTDDVHPRPIGQIHIFRFTVYYRGGGPNDAKIELEGMPHPGIPANGSGDHGGTAHFK